MSSPDVVSVVTPPSAVVANPEDVLCEMQIQLLKPAAADTELAKALILSWPLKAKRIWLLSEADAPRYIKPTFTGEITAAEKYAVLEFTLLLPRAETEDPTVVVPMTLSSIVQRHFKQLPFAARSGMSYVAYVRDVSNALPEQSPAFYYAVAAFSTQPERK